MIGEFVVFVSIGVRVYNLFVIIEKVYVMVICGNY